MINVGEIVQLNIDDDCAGRTFAGLLIVPCFLKEGCSGQTGQSIVIGQTARTLPLGAFRRDVAFVPTSR